MVASVYLDIKMDPVPEWLEKLVDFARVKKYSLILGMDSNSHSVLYGLDTNARGEELESFIVNNALSVENIGTVPTF